MSRPPALAHPDETIRPHAPMFTSERGTADGLLPPMSSLPIPSPCPEGDLCSPPRISRPKQSASIQPAPQAQLEHQSILPQKRSYTSAYGSSGQSDWGWPGTIRLDPAAMHRSLHQSLHTGRPPMDAPRAQPQGQSNPSVLEPTPRDRQARVDPFIPTYAYGTIPAPTGFRRSNDAPASRNSSCAGLDSQSMQQEASSVPLPQAEDRTSRYRLVIRQQPLAARACGMGERDRRVVDPPPIVQLSLKDFDPRSEADVDALRNPHNVLHCTLLDVSGSDVTQTKDSHNSKMSRRLTGSIMASPFIGIDPAAPPSKVENARLGCFFIFPDISCRQVGHYRLRFKFVQQTIEGLFTGSHARILGVIESDVFEVFTAKDFPGMRPSTDLMVELKRQGASVSVRRGSDARVSTRA